LKKASGYPRRQGKIKPSREGASSLSRGVSEGTSGGKWFVKRVWEGRKCWRGGERKKVVCFRKEGVSNFLRKSAAGIRRKAASFMEATRFIYARGGGSFHGGSEGWARLRGSS